MLVRLKHESDGKCFACIGGACAALREKDKYCGTYFCPFYKPEGCEDWVRIDHSASVDMYEPGERI